MDQHFSVCGIKIPIELKPIYEEVSRTFEAKVVDAIKTKKEEDKSEMD